MASIAHTLPAVITVRDGAGVGFARPGLQQTAFISGRYLSRDWHGYNVREYDLEPTMWQSGTTALEEWSAFWHQIDGAGGEGYLVEPVSEIHRSLLCGGLGDGTKTTFPVPALAPTSVTVFVNGVPQESSAYTVHSVANEASDALASCADDATYTVDNGTHADVTGVSLDGLSCIKITPAGGAAPELRGTSRITGITASTEYTSLGWVLCTNASAQNYRARILWYTSGASYISASAGSDVAIDSADGWTAVSVTATAPATAAEASVRVQRNDTSGTVPYYVDCLALNSGDYDRWHLPSVAPGLIEFATAPAAGARITATATCRRVTRCRFEPGSRWTLTSPGHAVGRSIRAVEVVEF